ncbi:MAG: hypothetical protein H6815_04380 [Phycisphaeraceae bacterium]|nr:hypothetical protein [Phycisphaerales bacterium]MCB9859669.1 hypothetical protein [Phycisphaeraceae bacterium]
MTLITLAETAAWWTNQQAGLVGGLGGGIGGSACGLLGAAAGVCVPRGIGRRYVLGGMLMFVVLGVLSLLVGFIAIGMGQPWHVYYPLLIIGLVFSGVCGPLIFVIRKQYTIAEQRRMDAEAIRRSGAVGA